MLRARAVAASRLPKDFYTDLAEGYVAERAGFRFSASACFAIMCPAAGRLPSSVIMNAVAQAVSVQRIAAIATPPRRDNRGRPAEQDHPRHLRHPRC